MSDIVKNDRPESEDGRLEKELRCYDFLDRLKIPYRRIDHEMAMTMEACEEIEQVLECSICKNLMLTNRQETDFYLLLMPGDKPFKTKNLSAQIGRDYLCKTGIYGKISGYYTGVAEYIRINE